jgi:hypothetical protein
MRWMRRQHAADEEGSSFRFASALLIRLLRRMLPPHPPQLSLRLCSLVREEAADYFSFSSALAEVLPQR